MFLWCLLAVFFFTAGEGMTTEKRTDSTTNFEGTVTENYYTTQTPRVTDRDSMATHSPSSTGRLSEPTSETTEGTTVSRMTTAGVSGTTPENSDFNTTGRTTSGETLITMTDTVEPHSSSTSESPTESNKVTSNAVTNNNTTPTSSNTQATSKTTLLDPDTTRIPTTSQISQNGTTQNQEFTSARTDMTRLKTTAFKSTRVTNYTTLSPTTSQSNSDTTTIASSTERNNVTVTATTVEYIDTSTITPTTGYNSNTTAITATTGNDSNTTAITATTGNDSNTTVITATTGNDSNTTAITATTGNDSNTTPITATTGNDNNTTAITATTGNDSNTTSITATTGNDNNTTSITATTIIATTVYYNDTTTLTPTTEHNNNTTTYRDTTAPTSSAIPTVGATSPPNNTTFMTETTYINDLSTPTMLTPTIDTTTSMMHSEPTTTAMSPTSTFPVSPTTTPNPSDSPTTSSEAASTTQRTVIFCASRSCPLKSICINGTCQCLSGSFLLDDQCVQAQVFPGQLHLTSLIFDEEMLDRSSKVFQKTAADISAELREALEDLTGYIRTDVVQLRPGSVFATVNNIFQNSDASQESVDENIKAAINGSQGLLARAGYTAVNLCEQEPLPCDNDTTSCMQGNGLASCTCNDGYISNFYSNTSCTACPSGQKAVRRMDKCEACPFGFAGLNCDDTSLMAVVVVSCVLGSVLLILILALIVFSCRSRSGNKADIGLSPYPSGTINQQWPTGVTPIPRATTKWDGAASIEMTEGGSALVDKKQTNGLSGSYDLNAEKMKTFKGKNTSRYSYLVQGHENPYFLPGEERKE